MRLFKYWCYFVNSFLSVFLSICCVDISSLITLHACLILLINCSVVILLVLVGNVITSLSYLYLMVFYESFCFKLMGIGYGQRILVCVLFFFDG